MLTMNARSELKNLKLTIEGCVTGVKSIEMAVKSWNYSVKYAASDNNFRKSDEYAQLEKMFSTFRLPKASEWTNYCTKAIAILDTVLYVAPVLSNEPSPIVAFLRSMNWTR